VAPPVVYQEPAVLRLRVVSAAALTIFAWASAFSAQRRALRSYPPAELALLRFLVASALLASIRPILRSRTPGIGDLPGILLAGLLGIFFYHLAILNGQLSVTAGSASFLSNTSPIFTAILAVLLLKERLGGAGWAGLGTGFLGATLIALGEGHHWQLDPGALLILAGALSWSFWFVIQKQFLTRYTALEFTTYTIWAGTLLLLPFLPRLVSHVRSYSPSATAAVVYLGVVPSAVGYVTWAYVLSQIPVSRAAAFLYLIPPLAVLVAWGWLSEVPAPESLIGGAISLVGIALVNRDRERASTAGARSPRTAPGR